MTGPEMFGAIVRGIGVYWLSVGIGYFAGAYFASEGFTSGSYVVHGAAYLVIGVFLMFKADGMVETCYSLNALNGTNAPANNRIHRNSREPSGDRISEDPDSPQVLIKAPTETQAALIVNHLTANGIKASALGGGLGAIWPEVPREVQVVVRQADVPRASELLDSLESSDG